METITAEEFETSVRELNPRANKEWDRTIARVLMLQIGEGARLYAEDYGYAAGTAEYEEFPSKEDAARLRSILYNRGLLVSIHRVMDDESHYGYLLMSVVAERS